MQRTTISPEMPNENIIQVDSEEIEEVDYTEDDTGNVEHKVLHGSSAGKQEPSHMKLLTTAVK